MTDRLETLTEAALDAARRAGAEAADALAIEAAAITIDVRRGRLEQAERAEGTDIGLRVLVGRRQACVAASDTRPETLAALAERAVAMAREAPEDPTVGLAEPGDLAREWDLAALDLEDPAADPTAGELEEAARSAEAAALAHTGISQVDSATATFSRRRLRMAATNGFRGGYTRTSHALGCTAITGEGTAMERDWCWESRTYRADLPSAAEIGALAAERALARAGARKPPTGTFPVLYDERVADQLIGHLLGAISGTAVARGASWLKDAMGERVLPAGLSLIEDPTRPRISGSRPFDAEGLPAVPRPIVEDGVLVRWLLDLSTARKLGLSSTANAYRNAGSPPSPGAGNVALTQGGRSREELIAAMGTGLLVTAMIGSTINPTTGDYSRGASGFWVENGAIAYPVNECTVAGNLREMLGRIVPANDARAHESRVVPSLLVEGMTIAGA
ncbi:MAG: TldD/PmbA family protein [Rhodobacteraceae bacterium]|nr:TldD/PmbA family protein [Paracoccaceae bacterium]